MPRNDTPRRANGWRTNLFAAAASVAAILAGCASAPLEYPRTQSAALRDTSDVALADASAAWRQDDPSRNGFYPLLAGMDAFGARLRLIDQAERSIDIQYFLMKPDEAGLVFSEKLIEAANRGVRVRFLLDDIFTTVDDRALIVLNEHPNIDVRLFNPIARKGVWAFNYVGHFRLANRRMHNKSFIVDNQIAIVGGRNIAAEYFQLDPSGEFLDFDMLCAGPIVADVSDSFDTYWNHELAVPMHAFYDSVDSTEIERQTREIERRMEESGDSVYANAIRTSLVEDLSAGRLSAYSADARVIIDDPGKLLESISDEQRIVGAEIAHAVSAAEEEVIAFTPYFIPGDTAMQILGSLVERGVRVVIVTNSLATNNHTSVHSAYSSYRPELLANGVELWEARADATLSEQIDDEAPLEKLTLHTKGLIIDRRRVFVGSLNVDPRSIDINTEMGILIESPELGELLAETALRRTPEFAYRLELAEDGDIVWRATVAGEEVVETREPETSVWRRLEAWILKIAPERQL